MIQRKIRRLGLGLMMSLGLLFSAVTPAQAGWLTHEAAGVKVNVPDDWQQSPAGEEGMMIVAPKDDSLMVMFWVVEGEDLEAILTAFEPEFKKLVTDIKYTTEKPKDIEINGMKAFYMDGSGKIEGAPADWEIAVVMAAKPLIMISLAKKGAFTTHQEALSKMVNSMQAL